MKKSYPKSDRGAGGQAALQIREDRSGIDGQDTDAPEGPAADYRFFRSGKVMKKVMTNC